MTRRILYCIFFVALEVVASAAGWPKPAAPFFHAPDARTAGARAAMWRAAGFEVGEVAYTGSMKPWLQGGELVVLERFTSQALTPGLVLSFERSAAAPRVLHMVVEANARAAYMTGINNRWSDGWILRDRVRWIVREVIRWPRPAPLK